MPPSLADLDARAVTDALLGIARRVREAVATGDRTRIGAALDEVRQAGDAATGETLRLLEVAEGFLKAALGTNWGRREKVLRAFVAAYPDEGPRMLDEALRARLQPTRIESEEIRAALQELVDVGALRGHEGRLDVPPSMRGIVQEIIQPVSFRLWDWVQRARAKAALEHPEDDRLQAHTLVADLGVSEGEARQHLSHHPLRGQPLATAEPPSRRELQRPFITAGGAYKAVVFEKPPSDTVPSLSTTAALAQSVLLRSVGSPSETASLQDARVSCVEPASADRALWPS